MVNKAAKQVLCLAFSNGRTHDYKLFKNSLTKMHSGITMELDSGYSGVTTIHKNSKLPKKKSKMNPLTKSDKLENKELSVSRVVVENVIGRLKTFRILAERYRNRRKRFALRWNLIAAIYNFEL